MAKAARWSSGAHVDGGHRRCDLPALAAVVGGGLDEEIAGLVFTAGDGEKNTRAVEKRVGQIEMRGAHAQVPRIDRRCDRDVGAAGDDVPAVLVDLFDGRSNDDATQPTSTR